MDKIRCPHCGTVYDFMHLPEHCSPEVRARAYAPHSRWFGSEHSVIATTALLLLLAFLFWAGYAIFGYASFGYRVL